MIANKFKIMTKIAEDVMNAEPVEPTGTATFIGNDLEMTFDADPEAMDLVTMTPDEWKDWLIKVVTDTMIAGTTILKEHFDINASASYEIIAFSSLRFSVRFMCQEV